MVPFNTAPYVPTSMEYVRQAVRENQHISGDGPFTKLCHGWLKDQLGVSHALLTTSGTSSLEMAALLCDLAPGDEVILPSYTFTSTATAFVAVGAVPVFVDIRPDTMNIDENCLEAALTSRTRALVPVHYAGVACEMDTINDLANAHNLLVVEDAAQAITSTYKGRPAGALGDLGCFSFHETKNFSMGEGGALTSLNDTLMERAEIIREKGTNRSRFLRGQVDKYTWVDKGGSYLPSDMNAAYLWGQLEQAADISHDRMETWHAYATAFACLEQAERIQLPVIPRECSHNAHMFYIKCRDLADRTSFIAHMKEREVRCAFHYVPLHSSPAGQKFGRFVGADRFTTAESERLVRLPLYYGMTQADRDYVIQCVLDYFQQH